MTRSLYLVRHAQSHPATDTHTSRWPLSDRGRQQASQLVPELEPLGIDAVFCSPYLRCRDTIAQFARHAGHEVRVVDGLHERRISRGIIDDFYDVWCRSWEDFDYALPSCESSAGAQARMLGAIESICRDPDWTRAAVCSHGNVIGLFLNHLDPTFGRERSEALRNPDVIRVEVGDRGYAWDPEFEVHGLRRFASRHEETPVRR